MKEVKNESPLENGNTNEKDLFEKVNIYQELSWLKWEFWAYEFDRHQSANVYGVAGSLLVWRHHQFVIFFLHVRRTLPKYNVDKVNICLSKNVFIFFYRVAVYCLMTWIKKCGPWKIAYFFPRFFFLALPLAFLRFYLCV